MADDKKDFVSQLQGRTKQFVLRSIKVFKALPPTEEARVVGKQFLRSASSVGANYRAVCPSKKSK